MFKKLAKYGAATATSVQLFVSKAIAQTPDEFIDGSINNAVGGNLIDWVQRALNLVIGLAGLIAVAVLIYSGIQYITAGGDENKVDKATKGITYAIIGLIICFIAVLIVTFVIERVIQSGS